jgi:hypothetical protein
MRVRNRKSGAILIEIITAMFLLGLMLAMLAVSLNGYGSFNDYLLTRQRCTAAAEAQLDSIAATGAGLNDETIKRLWPNVRLSIEKSDGAGQWKGLELVIVRAEAKSRRKAVHLELSRYFLPRQER